jgi:hypothetical protein
VGPIAVQSRELGFERLADRGRGDEDAVGDVRRPELRERRDDVALVERRGDALAEQFAPNPGFAS